MKVIWLISIGRVIAAFSPAAVSLYKWFPNGAIRWTLTAFRPKRAGRVSMMLFYIQVSAIVLGTIMLAAGGLWFYPSVVFYANDRLIEKQKRKKTRAKQCTVKGTWRNYNFLKLTPNTTITYPVRPHIIYSRYWINAIRRRLTSHDAKKLCVFFYR